MVLQRDQGVHAHHDHDPGQEDPQSPQKAHAQDDDEGEKARGGERQPPEIPVVAHPPERLCQSPGDVEEIVVVVRREPVSPGQVVQVARQHQRAEQGDDGAADGPPGPVANNENKQQSRERQVLHP